MSDETPTAAADSDDAPPSRLARMLPRLAPILGTLFAVAMTVRTHLHFLVPYATPVSNDEGYIAAMALRMVRGHWLPYVDAVSQRGPVLYWVGALGMRLGGLWSWVPMRVMALTVALSTLGLLTLASREMFTPFAGAVATLFASYFLCYELAPWDGIGFNGEVLSIQWVLLSLWCVARAQREQDGPRPLMRHRDRWVIAAGAFAALAGLTKQVTFFNALPSALWLLLGRPHTDDSRRARALDVARFSLGFAVPFALVVGVYAASGHLREFVYYFQRYGREVFMAPVTVDVYRDKLREQIDKYFLGIAAVSAMAVLLIARAARSLVERPGPWYRRLQAEAPTVVVLVHLAGAAAGAAFTGRFFPHYFVQVYPMAALVAGCALATFGDARTPRDRGAAAAGLTVVFGAGILLLIASTALARNVRLRRETDRWYQDPHADPVVRYVSEKTQPDDTIFVWGFRAETYVSARRWPASRFVYTVYPSGVVPWFQATRDQEEHRVVPGSREQLLDDMERNRPELVVDAGRSMSGRYMYNYPVLRNYLDRTYCFMRYVDGEPVYRRKHGATCPPADY